MRLTWDHPRSRGVYYPHVAHFSVPDGSSPLARGLPAWLRPGRPSFGIIPARAGFTISISIAMACSPDHPRSRGVYVVMVLGSAPVAGSSPLARGLLVEMIRKGASDRIIPARAGFTSRTCSTRRTGADHPRSRGVYLLLLSSFRFAAGSSPLARGLPVLGRRGGRSAGIIPARAGFTSIFPGY